MKIIRGTAHQVTVEEMIAYIIVSSVTKTTKYKISSCVKQHIDLR